MRFGRLLSRGDSFRLILVVICLFDMAAVALSLDYVASEQSVVEQVIDDQPKALAEKDAVVENDVRPMIIPEPSSLSLFGLASVWLLRRRVRS